jgi:hypothetical protein
LKFIFSQADLKLMQRRWLELIKDYELEVHYHSGEGKCRCGRAESEGSVQLLASCTFY